MPLVLHPHTAPFPFPGDPSRDSQTHHRHFILNIYLLGYTKSKLWHAGSSHLKGPACHTTDFWHLSAWPRSLLSPHLGWVSGAREFRLQVLSSVIGGSWWRNTPASSFLSRTLLGVCWIEPQLPTPLLIPHASWDPLSKKLLAQKSLSPPLHTKKPKLRHNTVFFLPKVMPLWHQTGTMSS